MKSSLVFLKNEKGILKPIYKFSSLRKIKLYLVGGVLRDLFLNRARKNPDFDFCLKKGAINFGRLLARELRGGFVVLDKQHGACRVVKRINNNVYTFDFTDFRGKSLEADLLHRDFTINAMALELGNIFSKPYLTDMLFDPFGAKNDLKGKIIKMVNKDAFLEDPLRILRAFSFASILDFSIDRETLRQAKSAKSKHADISFERIRDELFKIFSTENAYEYLFRLDELKILKIIFPEIEKMRGIGQGPYHHLDVWQHTLETVKQFEILLRELKRNKEIQVYLNADVSSGRSRYALIKLAALLHDVGKPAALRREDGKIKFHGHERIGLRITEEISKRLKLSNGELNSLKTIVLRHLRPGYLADVEELTPRAKFRFFRDAADETISILLLSVADQRATKGPLTTSNSRFRQEKLAFGLIREYLRKKKEKKIPRLLTGDDLIKKFKLEPSPLIGKILFELEELQAIGKIKTKQQALKAAGKLAKA